MYQIWLAFIDKGKFHKSFTLCFDLGGLHHRRLRHPSNLLKRFGIVLGFVRMCRFGWLGFAGADIRGIESVRSVL
ncbi:unnamed protein product [Arabis nemorensis]|uniref:Uncharacterized protein n=1 Tax=Arabis nemorensis TaxID=586526 RepID=A0A565BUK1_9BRAS|nr:unnamed protein product [Arabis nemorensis]